MIKRILCAILSLVLITTLVFENPIRIFAESVPQYIEEVRISTASTKEAAYAELSGDGFTVFDYNLRDGLSGNVCYIGYKTTTDESKAITDIRIMNAKGGINEKKYRELVAQWKTGIETTASYFKKACNEVAINYKKGSPLAKASVELLDLFEVDGVKLSTYLFDANRKDSDFEDIILICSDNVVATIYSALYLGIADYNVESFAKKLGSLDFSQFDYEKIRRAGANETFTQYWERTARVLSSLQQFGLDYDDAAYFFEEYEQTGEQTEIDTPTEEESIEYWKKFVDEKYQNSESEEEQELYKYATIMGLYEKLSRYSINNSSYENLAEYIYYCGYPFDEEGEESDNVIYRVYPLVSCLTEGQLFALQYGGVSALVSALDANTEENYNITAAATNELKLKIKENGVERISIFYNVDRDIYDQTVAFTDEANRVGIASSSFDKLVEEKEDDKLTKVLTNIILIGGMIAGALLVVAILTLGFTAAIAGTTMATLVSVGFIAMLSGSIAIASGGMTLATSAIVAGVVGTVFVVVALVVLAILVICALIAFIKSLFSEEEDDEEEELPNKPDIIYDIKDNSFTKYEAVKNKNGEAVDITCGSGKQWDVLFVSHSESAGKPVSADGDVFNVKRDSSTASSGYTPVSRFGYIDTANLRSFEGNSKSPLYLFFQGSSRDGDGKEKYLSDLMLSEQNSKEAARLDIINMGYIPLEQNLTPGTSKVTYLGYKTTSDSSDAITDIRIAYYYSAQVFYYGNKSDGSPVEYALVGQLVTKASLYYTRQKTNGSAIIADFKFSSTKLSASSGYEPVILFSGGECYNLYNGSDEMDGLYVIEEDNWDDKLYMYFKPSVTFSSSGTQYISGFAFCSSSNDSLTFAKDNGFKIVEYLGYYDIASGVHEGETYIMYSTTNNPYRAITDIGTFNASNSAESLFENISVGGVGYAVCETFAQVRDEGFFSNDYYRILRPSNSYITRINYEGANDNLEYINTTYVAINNFGKYKKIPMKGLYVAGPNSNKNPITIYDINFCTDPETAGRTAFVNYYGETVWCKPVKDLTEYYSTVADNLTFEWDYEIYTSHSDRDYYYPLDIDFNHYLRIFLRGSVEKRGKYVSNIIVASNDTTNDKDQKYSYDQTMVKLLSQGVGEIIKVNLARSSSSQPVKHEYREENGTITDLLICDDCCCAATYVMIQYTDYLIESVRTVATKWYSSGDETATKKLDYQGTKFDLTGDKVKGISGSYAFYSSKNGQLGAAVTDILLDSDYLKAGYITVTSTDGVARTGEDYVLKLKQSNDTNTESFIKNITISSKGSRKACIEDLYRKGCNAFIDEDKNGGLGGDYVYIGYQTTIDENDSNIVRGIELYANSSSSHPSSYTNSSGLYYECISGDLNKGVGGDYTYLYVTKSTSASPITCLTTTGIMASSLSKYTDYVTHDWVTTGNLSNGTKGTCKLCYKQKDNTWKIDDNGTLTISISGNMKDYSKSMRIFYIRPGAMGGMAKYVEYLPEWCQYADSIKNVAVYSSTTSIDDCAFYKCQNIENIYVFNKECDIQANSIPANVKINGYYGSTAEKYAANNGFKFIGFSPLMGTVLGGKSVVVIASISFAFIVTGVVAFVYKKKRKQKIGEK